MQLTFTAPETDTTESLELSPETPMREVLSLLSALFDIPQDSLLLASNQEYVHPHNY